MTTSTGSNRNRRTLIDCDYNSWPKFHGKIGNTVTDDVRANKFKKIRARIAQLTNKASVTVDPNWSHFDRSFLRSVRSPVPGSMERFDEGGRTTAKFNWSRSGHNFASTEELSTTRTLSFYAF